MRRAIWFWLLSVVGVACFAMFFVAMYVEGVSSHNADYFILMSVMLLHLANHEASDEQK